ncbi:MAG: DUF402 domain-containing protein [Crenarchaeota archaeon]|nr:DUF402 domain-containing protein [Thermoproteota archaeon]
MSNTSTPRIRIRGIYATALTKLFLDAGFTVTQASRVIVERFKIPDLTIPADVTLKNTDDDMNRLLLIGYPWAVDKALEVLREKLPYSLYLRSSLGVHATVAARLTGRRTDGGCEAIVKGVRVVVRGLEECREGEIVKGSVVHTALLPGEDIVVEPNTIQVVGDYAIVSKRPGGFRVTFSEHIRSSDRRALLASIAVPYTSNGYSIHWRSSARHGEEREIEEELRELVQRLKLIEAMQPTEDTVLEEGEALALVDVSSSDKEELDSLRAAVVPTLSHHHSIKANYRDTSLPEIIDYAEKALSHGAQEQPLRQALLEEAAERLSKQHRVELIHVKLDGSYISIGPGRLQSIEADGDGIRAVMERRVRSPGVYDGLGVEKEPGDTIYTYIDTSSWLIKHEYYSENGELKGIYLNINTPPEPTPTGFRYIDLEADLVNTGGGWRLIDAEKLANAYREGRVTRRLLERVAEIVSEKTGEPVADVLARLSGETRNTAAQA